MDLEADLVGILSLLRRHIEIRNRSWMRRVHRDCFIASEAVDFLVTQGLADTRKDAVAMGRKMVAKRLIKHVTDSQRFGDSYHYFRFMEDEDESSVLANTNAGNGKGIFLGQGGCKWSFSPHTAHNSYVLDIALAEEIERAVAGASVEARALAVNKLRSRVREQALANAPDWLLTRATVVNNTMISLYERKRPRGDFLNVKMDGMVGEGPKQFISSILSMTKRRQWEGTFEDGVVVEGIDIGESTSVLTKEDEVISPGSSPMPTQSPIQTMTSNDATVSVAAAAEESTPSLPESSLKQLQNTKVARKTDDVLTFLTTVDLAGVPPGMAIAFLNDPERQHALAHLRKQMMLSNPEECMLCQSPFETAASIRFCPCCAMVSCSRCVSKRVFEVVSRQVVSVCVHCFRESSRVRHPPQAVQDTSGIDESLRGKWWRPEELGIVDYSHSRPRTMSQLAEIEDAGDADMFGDPESTVGSRAVREESSMYNDLDQLVLQKEDLQTLRPLVPGILDGLFDNNQTDANNENSRDLESPAELTKKNSTRSASPVPISNITSAINSVAKKAFSSIANKKPTDDLGAASPSSSGSSAGAAKTARCKNCGLLISRDMDAIEAHMEECTGVAENSAKRTSSTISGIRNRFRSNTSPAPDLRSFHINEKDGSMVVSHGTSKSFGGIRRSTERNAYGTRVIYRTARSNVKAVRPREVCAFQDSFIDDDGTCYAYEVSVRHCDARGLPDYVTADVLLLLYAARPVPGSKSMSNITIISQVDTRSRSPQWLLSFMMDDNMGKVGVLGKEDLVRELKQCGNLQNILQNDRQQTLDAEEGQAASLSDFELLAVLGRGGFGKVMQVRHIPSGEVYAMKILKKSELRRRRQIERTQTERTILANVRHPFIVCLHYAFQSPQKLYMVMDFVQGGDFFTLMRKFKRIPEDWVKLYVLEVAMALQHLHDMDVVYRDLKPENILLCGDGHLKLTDFGLSRFFETRPPAPEDIVGDDNNDMVTRSFCGTEQYMSPEMLLQQGHNFRMDWWCLGLLMHEMISARHPFHGPSHYDTLRNMVTKPPTIDQRLSAQAAAVVRSFLVKNPKSRLCCKEGIKELQRLAYFSTGIDWDDLFNRRKPMPYIPRLHDSTDISSFEATFTNETPVDSVADAGNSSQVGGKKKGFFGGLFGGNNTGTTDAADKIDNDSFKGFSFTKDDSVLSDPEAGKARTAAMAIPRTSDMTESNKSGSAGEGAASPVGREVADSSGSYVPPPPPEPSQDSLSSQ